MNLQIALHYIFLKYSTSVLKDSNNLINCLNHFGVFEAMPFAKLILEYLTSNESLLYIFLLTKEQREEYLENFISKTGFDEQKVRDIFHILRAAVRAYHTDKEIVKSLELEGDKIPDIITIGDCRYAKKGKILISCSNTLPYIEISSECIAIHYDAFSQISNCELIIIPETVKYIGVNAIWPDDVNLANHSPYFVLEDGLFMTSDKQRLLKCISTSNILNIPPTLTHIDDVAFPTLSHLSWGSREFGNPKPPYFLRILGDHIPTINFPETYFIATKETNNKLLLNAGIDKSRIINQDVFVDSFGAIYTIDKKTLLCYPKELPYTSYSILDGCEAMANCAFNFFASIEVGEEPDYEDLDFAERRETDIIKSSLLPPTKLNTTFDCNEYVVIHEGNNIRSLRIPNSMRQIGVDALLGLSNLTEIILEKDNSDSIIQLLSEYNQKNSDPILSKVKVTIIQ